MALKNEIDDGSIQQIASVIGRGVATGTLDAMTRWRDVSKKALSLSTKGAFGDMLRAIRGKNQNLVWIDDPIWIDETVTMDEIWDETSGDNDIAIDLTKETPPPVRIPIGTRIFYFFWGANVSAATTYSFVYGEDVWPARLPLPHEWLRIHPNAAYSSQTIQDRITKAHTNGFNTYMALPESDGNVYIAYEGPSIADLL